MKLTIRFGDNDLLTATINPNARRIRFAVGVRTPKGAKYLLSWAAYRPNEVRVRLNGHINLLRIGHPNRAQYELLTFLQSRSKPFYRLLRMVLKGEEMAALSPPRFLNPTVRHALDDLPLAARALTLGALSRFDVSPLKRILTPVTNAPQTNQTTIQQSTYFQSFGSRKGLTDMINVEYDGDDQLNVHISIKSLKYLPTLE